MELFGLILAFPATLIASVVYCSVGLAILSRWGAVRRIATVASILVAGCILIEVLMLTSFGAKEAYQRSGMFFASIHLLSFWFGPPSVANSLLIPASRSADPRWFKISIACFLCWLTAFGAVVANIIIDEAIVGVDAGVPFYMTKP